MQPFIGKLLSSTLVLYPVCNFVRSERVDVLSVFLASGSVTGIGRLSRTYAQRSDSDSDDDHTSGPDYDSPGDGSEINHRILEALERLHQDMKKVLRRLTSVEEAVVSAQVGNIFLHS